MINNRRDNKYKYPSDTKAIEGKEKTQSIVNKINGDKHDTKHHKPSTSFFHHNKKEKKSELKNQKSKDKCYWEIRFRQMDLISRLNDSFKKEAKTDGHCQVLATMYMHLRELTKGNAEVAYKLFKYWCFMDHESVLELAKQDNKNGYWLQGFLSGNKTFLYDFFDPDGQFSIPNVALNFWGGHETRKVGAKDVGMVTVMSYHTNAASDKKSFEFIGSQCEQNDMQATDDFIFLHEYEHNIVLKRNGVYIDSQECIGTVVAREVFKAYNPEEKFNDQQEIRILINLKNKTDDTSHAVVLTRYSDAMDHFEFVDGNRGVFLIPVNSKKLETFLTDYFNQSIYERFNFSKIQIEEYNRVDDVRLASPRTQHVHSVAFQRKKSIEDLRRRSSEEVNIDLPSHSKTGKKRT